MIVTMTFAKGDIAVEEHEKTGGVKITRQTPELQHVEEQAIIIPCQDVENVLFQVAEIVDKRLIDEDVAKATDDLIQIADSNSIQ